MTVIFKDVTKHGGVTFTPKVPLGFEDPDAEPYFVAAGWAEETDRKPVMTYPEATVAVDPLARVSETGQFVQPKVAEAHLAKHKGNPPPAPHELAFDASLIQPEGGTSNG